MTVVCFMLLVGMCDAVNIRRGGRSWCTSYYCGPLGATSEPTELTKITERHLRNQADTRAYINSERV